ncbi:preprotein translocase subunit SecD [Cryobacterium sp. MP_M3]|uniref:protein translocase subunit SecD n=1 Tax=unclassified Cryobacterium TaxID=2649013 RepID=UPI0018C9DE62|nr:MULTISPECIES: protein translocase subunit SecD [unclassified Cryobacterium]MBG6059828.1 preprotein translocase subunit SecD [Cryobacterium sp. MP_M3]
MAKSTPVKKAWRSLTWLGVIIVGLIALNSAGVLAGGGSWAPKLALDLEGGTQIILAPKLESGQSVSQEQLNQAVSIIRQRIDSAGVSEAEINTQGGQNIVVSIPGIPDDATINRIESSAKLEFRPVLVAAAPSAASVGGATSSATPSPTVDPNLSSTPTAVPTNGSDLSYVTPALQAQYDAFDCSKIDTSNVAPAKEPLVTCESDGSVKYILGPVEVSGQNVSNATNGQKTTQSGATTGEWVVNIAFDGTGTKDFATVSTRLSGLKGVQNQFAIVLDGKVISAPRTLAVITDGNAQISGNFTQNSSKTLADQLKFGALPISFTVQSQDTISATLGSTQLGSGLIAGLIGLILVVMYSLVQYRLLGLVTVASLTVAALITYLLITILSWREGYRLSLAGVAGLIVAIGITADSFIVYFERVRDELRDGRGLESSVEAGWKRALRTVLASDAVNFLAAGVLFIVAVGNVKGFALTLGLTTIVDVAVVMLFTHPMLQLLAQTRFFNEGHRFSGLDPRALGATYRGRAKFAPSPQLPSGKLASASREAAKRQTIAERKAAELVGSSTDRSTDGKDS